MATASWSSWEGIRHGNGLLSKILQENSEKDWKTANLQEF